jgi:phosphoglycolate phosphatase
MAIKGVLFDKDGTLLDYFETWMPVNRELSLAVADGDEALAQRLLVAIGYDPEQGLVRPGSVR